VRLYVTLSLLLVGGSWSL